MTPIGPRHRHARLPVLRQRGFSLVELMVGVAVGMVLVAGLTLMFANSSQSSTELDKSVRQIENGRYAMDALAEDISHAGYFDAAPVTTTTLTVSPCALSAEVAADLEVQRARSPPTLPFGIEGLTATQAADLAQPGQPTASRCLPGYKAGTPALIIRRLDTKTATVASLTTGLVYLQHSNNSDDVNASYRAGVQAADLPLKNIDGSPNAVRRYLPRVYFLATCNECGFDTVPTLKRAELKGNQIDVTSVAEGIESIGFDFGFDTDRNGAPDQWLGLNGNAAASTATAAAALGWGNVTAVRIYVLARATETSPGFQDTRDYASGLHGDVPTTAGPFNDSFKRRAYVTTARANNIAGPRESP